MSIPHHFLLTSDTAKRLYHEVAAPLPVIDYHCHLDAAVLQADSRFDDLTSLWIASDPYKHRAMRIAGVPESLITGGASSREKFDAWASTLPKTFGSPLFDWSAMELKRFFDIDEPLCPETANRIWSVANEKLSSADFGARNLLSLGNVACICTSDRLLDDLSAHERLGESSWTTSVLPSLRGDEITAVEGEGYRDWVHSLDENANNYDRFRSAVSRRLDAFVERGCRLADHALDNFGYVETGDAEVGELFDRRMEGRKLSDVESLRLRSGLLRFLATEYRRRDWTLQLHVGAQRRTSTRLKRLAGPAGGYAAPGSACDIDALCRFLDDIEQHCGLPRVILYNLNPADNAVFATLTGSYSEDGLPGKVQFGPAWWFNDHAFGIRAHLETLSSYGLLSTFIGMTTDSRSLMSVVRHDYFRRVLCDFIGGLVRDSSRANGIDELVRDLSFGNAERMLGLPRVVRSGGCPTHRTATHGD